MIRFHPGPWYVSPSAPSEVFASCLRTDDDMAEDDQIADVSSCEGGEMTLATARLIAAAPEMYKLLLEYVEVDMGTGIAPRALALLARIDGEDPA